MITKIIKQIKVTMFVLINKACMVAGTRIALVFETEKVKINETIILKRRKTPNPPY